jgi:hypothetical protein
LRKRPSRNWHFCRYTTETFFFDRNFSNSFVNVIKSDTYSVCLFNIPSNHFVFKGVWETDRLSVTIGLLRLLLIRPIAPMLPRHLAPNKGVDRNPKISLLCINRNIFKKCQSKRQDNSWSFYYFCLFFLLINISNNSFVNRIRTTRFLDRKFLLFYIREWIEGIKQFFFKDV